MSDYEEKRKQSCFMRWPYHQHPDHWEPYDYDTDYCGPEHNSWLNKLISRSILGVDMNKCCWAHDQRYKWAIIPQHFCDNFFLSDMVDAVKHKRGKWNPLRYITLLIAKRRYQVVSKVGHLYYGKD